MELKSVATPTQCYRCHTYRTITFPVSACTWAMRGDSPMTVRFPEFAREAGGSLSLDEIAPS